MTSLFSIIVLTSILLSLIAAQRINITRPPPLLPDGTIVSPQYVGCISEQRFFEILNNDNDVEFGVTTIQSNKEGCNTLMETARSLMRVTTTCTHFTSSTDVTHQFPVRQQSPSLLCTITNAQKGVGITHTLTYLSSIRSNPSSANFRSTAIATLTASKVYSQRHAVQVLYSDMRGD
ncbi:uncharacterized protein I303_101110 [Kwoniella dejecticola CBS 10117]|uniref:Uncharacterized protein n=1 Tax=Kwoniella dejecticola CBS 10117 TaxID=1296121 RepID=A0A1A6AGU7_9TREE|nr:uncharacterized protein I303_01114 [Kwoniella dejecticola CBS 10117]OBR89289.1 hypothetical protein I303_01114 [Kwoniella dejecticola CBS 10117]